MNHLKVSAVYLFLLIQPGFVALIWLGPEALRLKGACFLLALDLVLGLWIFTCLKFLPRLCASWCLYKGRPHPWFCRDEMGYVLFTLLALWVYLYPTHREDALKLAAMGGRNSAIEFLVKTGTDPNAAGALGSAAAFGNTSTVELLLKLGANPAFKDKAGNTPLGNARRFHHKEIETILSAAGARQ